MLAACEKELSADEHIALANRHILDLRYDQAEVELKNALVKNKEAVEARWLLGNVYLEVGDSVSAEKELRHAIAYGWNRGEVLPLLADALLSQAKYREVLELTVTALPPEVAARLLAAKALSAEELGDAHAAMSFINNALDYAPESLYVLSAQAQILVGEEDFSAAGIVLEQVISRKPIPVSVWRLMGDIHIGLKEPVKALDAYNNAIALEPNDLKTLFRRSMVLILLADYQGAQVDISELLRVKPQGAEANYAQGLIHFQRGRYSDAATHLWITAADFERYPLALFYLSCAQLKLGKSDLASQLAEQYLGLVQDSIRGRILLGYLRLLEGDYQGVRDLVGTILRFQSDVPEALKLMIIADLQENRVDEARRLISRFDALGPEASMSRVRLGSGRLLSGESSDAAEYLETFLDLGAEWQQTDVFHIVRELDQNNYPAAVARAERFQALNPQNPLPLVFLGRVHEAAKQYKKAAEAYERATYLSVGDPAANHGLAQIALSQEQTETAKSYYSEVLRYHKSDMDTLINLADLELAEENVDSAILYLERAIWANESEIEPRLILGRLQVAEGRPGIVANLFEDLDEVSRESPQVLELKALAKLARQEKQQNSTRMKTLAEASGSEREELRRLEQFNLSSAGRRWIARQVGILAPKYGLDPKLVLSVIKAESDFNPGARSPANALGLMQLIPSTAARFGVRNRADPIQNLRGGMSYLRWLLSFFDGDLTLALAGYNAGEGSVVKFLGIPPYPETQKYLSRILRSYGKIRHPPIEPVTRPTRFMPAIRAKRASLL